MGLRTEMNRPSWRAGAWAEADGPERISTAVRAAATARQAELANPTANRAAATMHSPRPSLPMSPHSLYLIINEPEPKSKHTRRVASLVLAFLALLVPKLRLGTHYRETLFRAHRPRTRNRVSPSGFPNRLGTRRTRRGDAVAAGTTPGNSRRTPLDCTRTASPAFLPPQKLDRHTFLSHSFPRDIVPGGHLVEP